MTPDGFERLDEDAVFSGRRFRVLRARWRFPDGRENEYDVIEHRGAVVVIPLLPGGEVVLVRQFRPAIGGEILELPAGTLEAGEAPRVCGERELREETGYRAGSLTHVLSLYPTPGISTERMDFFLAEGLEPGEADRDPGEHMRVEHHGVGDLLGRIGRGEVIDGKTIIGILWLARKMGVA